MAARVLRGAGGVGLVAATAWALHEALEETLVFRALRARGLASARGNAELEELLGPRIEAGPWYNSSLTVQGGGLASCRFPILGERRGSEVVVKALPRERWRSSVLYCLVGPGEWLPVQISAAVGLRAGGLPRRVDLLGTELEAERAAGGLPNMEERQLMMSGRGGGDTGAEGGRGEGARPGAPSPPPEKHQNP